MQVMKPWNELNREAKIKTLFDYPASMRDSQAKDLWGPEASGYYERICFPPTAPWNEILEIIKNSNARQTVYVKLTDKDFKVFNSHDIKKMNEKKETLPLKYSMLLSREYHAFLKWREKMCRSSKPKRIDLELYDDNRLISRVCTEEGDYGDEQGFGVEPDMWTCALFDFEGKVIQPFAPGYLSGP